MNNQDPITLFMYMALLVVPLLGVESRIVTDRFDPMFIMRDGLYTMTQTLPTRKIMRTFCFLNFDNYTELKWIGPQGLEITDDRSANIHVNEGYRAILLIFTTPTKADSGIYTCRAVYKGKVAEIRHSFVFGEVTSDDCPLTQNLTAGQLGIIRCGGPGDRIFIVRRNHTEVDPTWYFRANRVEVRIPNVTHNDAGTYSISVERNGMSTSMKVNVNVIDPPTPTQKENATYPIGIPILVVFALFVLMSLIDVICFWRFRRGVVFGIRQCIANQSCRFNVCEREVAEEANTPKDKRKLEIRLQPQMAEGSIPLRTTPLRFSHV